MVRKCIFIYMNHRPLDIYLEVYDMNMLKTIWCNRNGSVVRAEDCKYENPGSNPGLADLEFWQCFNNTTFSMAWKVISMIWKVILHDMKSDSCFSSPDGEKFGFYCECRNKIISSSKFSQSYVFEFLNKYLSHFFH